MHHTVLKVQQARRFLDWTQSPSYTRCCLCDARVQELHRNYCRRPHPLRVVPTRSLIHYSQLRCLDCAYPRPAFIEKWRRKAQRSQQELTDWNSAAKLSCVATANEWNSLELKSLPPSFSLDTSRNSAFPMEKNERI